MEKLDSEVIVIGSGSAGITAAIYLKRANANVVIIDSDAPGGLLNKISIVENYPGYGKITGPDLAYNMFMQMMDLNILYKQEKVIDIIDNGEVKIVKTETNEYITKSIIIATGRKAKSLGLPNENDLIGSGISWCAICDGALFKDKDVVVVGGGNSALEESLYLSAIAKSITIVHHRNEFTAENKIQDLVKKNPKIRIFYNSEVKQLNTSNNILNSVEIVNDEREKNIIKAEGMFIYIGFEPAISFLSNLNIEKKNGYIVVNENMKTSINNIYACGDVIAKDVYQITTAVGEASIAATTYLRENAK